MSTQQFSLAVVKGSSAGTSIQSTRPRISVGSADDNDLILTDPGVAPRHFSVLIDGERWRVSSQTGTPRVNVDRRWSHPENGRRGALIQVATAQLILYPGHLDAQTIEREVSQRRQGIPDDRFPTSLDLPRLTLDDPVQTAAQNETAKPGTTLPVIPAHVDPETIAQMETIAAARPPEDLRMAAQERLQEERRPTEPLAGDTRPAIHEGLPPRRAHDRRPHPGFPNPSRWGDVHPESGKGHRSDGRDTGPGRKTSAWDQAKRPPPTDPSLPEVIATPESQMMPVPDEVTRRRPLRPDLVGPPPPGGEPELDTVPHRPASRRNAWGDTRKPPRWGDPTSRALVAARGPRSNAWGDAEKRTEKTPPDPRKHRTSAVWPHHQDIDSEARRRQHHSQVRGEALSGVRHKVSLDALRRRHDPGLHVLRAPDGPMATSVRLLGARVEEFAKSLGHRAYMITSAEPLTGKTTTALNLALALAEDTNRRVALVEADFRHPRFAQILGIDDRLGLLPVIDRRARLADSAVKVSDRNLLLVPSGGRHRYPAEILASPRFKSLMTELVETVDVALIDAPAYNRLPTPTCSFRWSMPRSSSSCRP